MINFVAIFAILMYIGLPVWAWIYAICKLFIMLLALAAAK